MNAQNGCDFPANNLTSPFEAIYVFISMAGLRRTELLNAGSLSGGNVFALAKAALFKVNHQPARHEFTQSRRCRAQPHACVNKSLQSDPYRAVENVRL